VAGRPWRFLLALQIWRSAPRVIYQGEGLLKPSRSEGSTRRYTHEDMERLEVILKLTQDFGVNLAGVEIILNMREKSCTSPYRTRRTR
jgi:DNA-binding transcriptional MerR regulator